MTCVLHNSISSKLHPNTPPVFASSQSSGNQSPAPRDPECLQTPNASTPSSSTLSPRDEIINFLAGLNVSIEVAASVCQQILGMYDLWDSFTDHSEQDKNRRVERRETQVKFVNSNYGNPPPEKALITEREIVAVVNRMRTERYVPSMLSSYKIPHLHE
jgi:cyclin C